LVDGGILQNGAMNNRQRLNAETLNNKVEWNNIDFTFLSSQHILFLPATFGSYTSLMCKHTLFETFSCYVVFPVLELLQLATDQHIRTDRNTFPIKLISTL
jgi:hypothetical protein